MLEAGHFGVARRKADVRHLPDLDLVLVIAVNGNVYPETVPLDQTAQINVDN